MKLAITLVAFILLGCASPQRQAEKAVAKYAPYCETLGYERHTDPWRDCIVQRHMSREAAASRASAAAVAGAISRMK